MFLPKASARWLSPHPGHGEWGMKTHKWSIVKVEPGYNPNQPLCADESSSISMAKDWKDVTCQLCHLLRNPNKPKARKALKKILAKMLEESGG
jgi:hypothetical protein